MESALSLTWNRTPIPVADRRERYGVIARQHQSTLLRIATGYCKGNEALAQDLVQEALVNGYRAYLEGGFQEGTNAKAWLARILTNLFLNDYRRRKRWESDEEVDGREDLAADAMSEPDRALLEQILDGPIEEALQRLPEVQRLCVVLVDVEGLDYAEAAAALGCPVGTVRSRLARGRLALYEDLVEYGRRRGVVK